MDSPETHPPHQRAPLCPRCRELTLEFVQHQGRTLGICRRCRGLWCESCGWDEARHGAAPIVSPFSERAPDLVAAGPSELECPECRRAMTVLQVTAVEDLEIDQCDTCGGVWFDRREGEYLDALRTWQDHEESSSRPTTWAQWFFQLVLQLPVEFNVPPRRPPYVTYAIIAFSLLVHVLGGAAAFATLGVDREILGESGGYWALLTHQFVHASWIHLLGNLYFLFILGDNIEDVLGPLWFLLLYLASGVAAAAVHLAFIPDGLLVGASGAIAGVMAAYLVLFPSARLTFMLIIKQFKVPAWAWLSVWFAFQIVGASLDPTGATTHIGWLAHIGGFLVGLVAVWPLRAFLVRRHPLLSLLYDRRLASRKAPS